MMYTKGKYIGWIKEYEGRLVNMDRKRKALYDKILGWKAKVDEFEDDGSKVCTLASNVRQFTGVSLRKMGKYVKRNSREWVARGIYFKYGIENGYSGPQLASYFNHKPDMAYRYRRSFTSSFESNTVNLEKYNNFKQFLLENEE